MVALIKRYSNGKLYSISASGYVTLAEVLELSKTCDVLVIDNRTKVDITEYILFKANTKSLTPSMVPTL